MLANDRLELSSENGRLRVETTYRHGDNSIAVNVLIQRDEKATVLQIHERTLAAAIEDLTSLLALVRRTQQ